MVNLTISTVAAGMLATGDPTMAALGALLAVFFPVVVATITLPFVSFGVILVAAAISSATLTRVPPEKRGHRFLQTMTDLGAIALTLPWVGTSLFFMASQFG